MKILLAFLFSILLFTFTDSFNSDFTCFTQYNYSENNKLNNIWELNLINAPNAWKQDITGRGITIAIIDSGIDYANKDLFDNIGPGINIISNSTDPVGIQDTLGHGTHVASIIGGNGKGLGIMGVAPNVTFMPIKVTTRSYDIKDIDIANDIDIAKGIIWAANHGANIINISMGQSQKSRYLQDAVQYAQDKGCLLVAASGNHYSATNPGVFYPAGEPGVIAVSAIDFQCIIAGFANTGQQIKLTAPGVHVVGDRITNTYSYIGYADGTSVAAPFISGSAALLWSAYRDLTPNQITFLLQQSAKDLGPKGWDEKYGFGIPDVAEALKLASSIKTLSGTNTKIITEKF